jgi:hypothetical protein
LPGFSATFAAGDPLSWLSQPVEGGLRIIGNVSLELWVRNGGAPDPVVTGGSPNPGYQLFNQVGDERAYLPAFGREYGPAVPAPGSVDHYTETLPTPRGGFTIEADHRVRVTLTSLALDAVGGTGHTVLTGGTTPSQVRFSALCSPSRSWAPVAYHDETLFLFGNQGLFTGRIPPTEGVNTHTVWFDLDAKTERLTVGLRQGTDYDPSKDDADLTLVDAGGKVVWPAGSPASNEVAILWKENLEALMPPGRYGARVDTYSGVGYDGTVSILQERTTP